MAKKSFGRAEQIRATHARLDERLPGSVPERPGVCACVRRFLPTWPIGARLAPPRSRSPPTWRYRASAERSLCTHRVCQKQLPGLFVFFNFVRNSISQVLDYRGLKTRPLAPRYPSLPAHFPFALRSELRPIQNCAEARSRRETRKISALPNGTAEQRAV